MERLNKLFFLANCHMCIIQVGIKMLGIELIVP
jgi:hypothetical protein